MRAHPRTSVASGAAIGLALSLAMAASADQRGRGAELAAAGSCDEALPLLTQAYADDPKDGSSALLAAQCLLQLKRYAEAEPLLAELQRRVGAPSEVDLYLAIARYHLGNRSGARSALRRAESAVPMRAEVHLYRGLLLLDARAWKQAEAALRVARALDSDGVGPVASHYISVAQVAQGEAGNAALAARRLLEGESEEAWMSDARGSFGDPEWMPRNKWGAELSTGLEYDSNVVLRGEGVRTEDEISDQADFRAMWRLRGGIQLLELGGFRLGVVPAYTGTKLFDLGEFDTHLPSMGLWISRPLGERTWSRFDYQFAYAWVNGDPYLMMNSFSQNLVHAWSGWGTTTVFGRAFLSDYETQPSDVPDGPGTPGDPCLDPLDPYCGPAGIDESETRDRSGVAWGLGLDHVWSPREGPVELRAGLAYLDYRADGRESAFQSLEPRVGAGVALPLGLYANGWFFYTFRPYRAASTVPDLDDVLDNVQYPTSSEERRDQTLRTSVDLSRAFWKHTSVSLRYAFVCNYSNVDGLDYNRHIVGAYLTFRLGK